TLRERTEDIAPLAAYFLNQQDPELRFTPEALEMLRSYTWPGNVRELRNAITMAAIFVEGKQVRPCDLPAQVCDTTARHRGDGLRLEDLEQEAGVEASPHTRGRQDRAAVLLGISRRTLIRKLKTYAGQETTAQDH